MKTRRDQPVIKDYQELRNVLSLAACGYGSAVSEYYNGYDKDGWLHGGAKGYRKAKKLRDYCHEIWNHIHNTRTTREDVTCNQLDKLNILALAYAVLNSSSTVLSASIAFRLFERWGDYWLSDVFNEQYANETSREIQLEATLRRSYEFFISRAQMIELVKTLLDKAIAQNYPEQIVDDENGDIPLLECDDWNENNFEREINFPQYTHAQFFEKVEALKSSLRDSSKEINSSILGYN